MAYPALSEEQLAMYSTMSATEEQVIKANDKAKENFVKKQENLCLEMLGPVGNVKELRLLMLGKTGAGKSATSNLIIGGNDFQESAQTTSCTARVGFKSTMIDGIKVSVIDTPGFQDTNTTAEHVLHEMEKVLDYYEDGIHGVLFMFNMGNPRFTEEEQQTFRQIQEGNTLLGNSFMKNCYLILSHGNDILKEKTTKEYIEKEVKETTLFGNLIENVLGRRVVVVDNSETTPYGRQLQREQVVRMVAKHCSTPFIPDLFKKFLDRQKALAEEMPEKYRAQMDEVERELTEMKEKEAETGHKNDLFGEMMPILQMQVQQANEAAARTERASEERREQDRMDRMHYERRADERAAARERAADERAEKAANQQPQVIRVEQGTPACTIS